MALKFRRGSTQQQSGSLVFGEPFVNTTLNTLLIGGQSGDIQLVTTTQTASFAVTGSNTFIGNQNISGTVTSDIFLNPNTIFGSKTIPSGHNGLLIGPITSIDGAIIIENESNLVII